MDKWKKALLTVGSGAIGTLGPVGAVAATALNVFLNDNEKVDADTSANVFSSKLESLSPDDQGKVSQAYYSYLADGEKYQFKTHEVSVISEVDKLRIMEESDVSVGVRPKIALMMAQCVVGMLILMTAGLAWQTASTGKLPSWEVVAALYGLPSWVIRSYFRDRSLDKVTKANLLSGLPTSIGLGLGNNIKQFFSSTGK